MISLSDMGLCLGHNVKTKMQNMIEINVPTQSNRNVNVFFSSVQGLENARLTMEDLLWKLELHSDLKCKCHGLSPIWQFMPRRHASYGCLAIHACYYNTQFLIKSSCDFNFNNLTALGPLIISFIETSY